MLSPIKDRDRIRVAVISAHAVVRAGLKYMLGNQHSLAIIDEATTIADAVLLATKTRPDIALVDPDSDTIPFQSISDLTHAGVRVLVLSSTSDHRFRQRTLALGAAGVVSKEESIETLIRAIHTVHAGEIWLEPLTSIRSVLLGDPDPEHARIQTLTKREREIVSLVGNGLKNAAIGERLFISEATVRNHLTSVLSKLDLTDRFELAVYTFRHGLVVLEDGTQPRSRVGASSRGPRPAATRTPHE